MNSVMLVVAMSAGQSPGAGYPGAPGYYPVIPTQAAGQPAVQPMPTTGQPGTVAPNPTTPPPASGNGNGNGNGNGCTPACEEEPPAPPVYLLERTLRET